MSSQTPVVFVSGVAKEPMDIATMTLQWDLPRAVVVTYTDNLAENHMVRVISDSSGVIDQMIIDLENVCASCTLRADLIETLETLAAQGKWGAIVAQLPAAAEALQICKMLAYAPDDAPNIRLAASLVAVAGETLCSDVFGGDCFADRGLGTKPDDERGVGEALASMLEYADVVVAVDELLREGQELLQVLVRPNALVAESASELDTGLIFRGIHDLEDSEAWVNKISQSEVEYPNFEKVWVLKLETSLPFHPERLWESIEKLGSGTYRSRGYFWLPSRPQQICKWDGAGGHLNIGSGIEWGTDEPLTSITVIGMGDGREQLEREFRACLLTDSEIMSKGKFWEVSQDGYESWLGPIHAT